MYERSAIVLEKYFDTLFGFNQKYNIKEIFKSFESIVKEIEKYQIIITKEDKAKKEFDKISDDIAQLQKNQNRLYRSNLKLEEERNSLFNSLEETPTSVEKKLIKIELAVNENNEEMQELKKKYIIFFTDYEEKQAIKNECIKNRIDVENNYFALIKQANIELDGIDEQKIKDLEQFDELESTNKIELELTDIMLENGKSERVGFNEDVIKKAVRNRLNIAKREAECYLTIYKRLIRLLTEINNDSLKLGKYQKALRDASVKLAFIDSEKNYLIGFLDNERMTAINGKVAHNEMMKEASQNFDLDTKQIANLYELILREIANKASKKIYEELYSKTYLRNIEEKEKSFEREVNSIRIKAGTIINSNYWRIEGIKTIYRIFQKEVSEKFNKDLSELKLEEIEGAPILIQEEEKYLQVEKEKEEEKVIEIEKPQVKKQEMPKILIDNEDESSIEDDDFDYDEIDFDDDEDEIDYDDNDKQFEEIEEIDDNNEITTANEDSKVNEIDNNKISEKKVISEEPKLDKKSIETIEDDDVYSDYNEEDNDDDYIFEDEEFEEDDIEDPYADAYEKIKNNKKAKMPKYKEIKEKPKSKIKEKPKKETKSKKSANPFLKKIFKDKRKIS